MPARIRAGDMVAVISGNDRGKRGRVIRILPNRNRVIVEGVNYIQKHIRKSQKYPQGGRVRREAAIHISNVMPIDADTNQPTRTKVQEADGKRTRVARRTGAALSTGGAATAKKAAKAETGEE
ncbi:MAG: 50S ribosomal protein L24 [Planctomycetota bacterium]|nr:50S ribosomal protein L24 [Planctomycetota bacterium]